jgi:hypothetical protein
MKLKRYVAGLLCAWATVASGVAAISIKKTNYHGWAESYVIGNGAAEVVVVPAIGRVMQFRFAGESDGPFWENRAMDGKPVDAASKEWGNFGGDKTWPSPQADWPKVTPRGWPPPVAFDSIPVEARVEGEKLRLVSAVDPHFGIRSERVIALQEKGARMSIETTYFKAEGEPRKVGVWIITQLRDPDTIRIPGARGKYVKQSSDLPMGLVVATNGAVYVKRDPKKSSKIGTESPHMEWQNSRWSVGIDSPRIEGAEYPDEGSSAEVYTNPDPLQYVELEMLGPVKLMKVGDRLSQTNVYTLSKREFTKLAEGLEPLEKYLGTWRGKFVGGKNPNPLEDVTRFERALNGEGIRVLHSVNDGIYAGETMIIWNAAQKRIETFYFTTGGDRSEGVMEPREDGSIASTETLKNIEASEKDPVTQVRSVSRLLPDGRLHVKSEYLKKAGWQAGHEVIYTQDPGAVVVFK